MENLEKREDILELARELLDQVKAGQKALDSAKNWGLVDILGGGLFVDLLKHGKIREAKVHMEEIDRSLARFREELEGMELDSRKIDGLDGFMDIVFDGLFVDLFVHSKIKKNQAGLDQLEEELRNFIDRN